MNPAGQDRESSCCLCSSVEKEGASRTRALGAVALQGGEPAGSAADGEIISELALKVRELYAKEAGPSRTPS
jgi:hypothetical protein